jgi:hypothetical protein
MFSPAAKSSESPCSAAAFKVYLEPPHRGTSLGPLVSGANKPHVEQTKYLH